MGHQVGAAGLLGRLDQHEAAAVAAAGGLHRLDSGKARERGIAIVGAAPPVETLRLPHRLPRPEPLTPPRHRWLLVQMPIEHHRRPAGVGGCVAERLDLHNDQRGASRQPLHLHGHPGDRPGLDPRRHQPHGLVDVARRLPIGIERRRQRRQSDVALELNDDLISPDLRHNRRDSVPVHTQGPPC